MYRLDFLGFVGPGADTETEGYTAWAYLPTDALRTRFETQAEAREYLRANGKGPDEYGIDAVFAVIPA